jgi:hypothetical protein
MTGGPRGPFFVNLQKVPAMAKHAFYSPSASFRWLSCTASVAIDTSSITETTSPLAEAGTAMHLCAEKILTGKVKRTVVKGKTFNGIKMTPEMIDEIVLPYVDFVLDHVTPESTLLVEHKALIRKDCWGTCDCVILTPDDADPSRIHVIIIDLKTGAGLKVSPIDNSQINIYAAGICRDLELLGDIASVKVGIVQPPFNVFALVPVPLEKLYEFEGFVLQTIEDIEAGRITYKPSEDNCRFCRAASICPKLEELATDAAVEDFKGTKRMAAKTLAEKAERVPLLKAYISAVENEVEARLHAGKRVKGWKLVKGNRKRIWRYAEKTIDARMDKLKIPKTWRFSQSRRSPADMERMLKEHKKDPALIASLIDTVEGGPLVADESSTRPAYDQSGAAAEDFSSVNPKSRKARKSTTTKSRGRK